MATHEAGHAVAALALGCRLRSVTVARDGAAGHDGRVWLEAPADRHAAAVVLLAGMAAVADAGDVRPLGGGANDVGLAVAELVRGRLEDDPTAAVSAVLAELARAWAAALELAAEWRPEIRAGAAALELAQTMTAAEFATAAGGRLAELATGMEETTARPAGWPAFLPVANCKLCGWELVLPTAAYLAMPADDLALWRDYQRGRLCWRLHGETDET